MIKNIMNLYVIYVIMYIYNIIMYIYIYTYIHTQCLKNIGIFINWKFWISNILSNIFLYKNFHYNFINELYNKK